MGLLGAGLARGGQMLYNKDWICRERIESIMIRDNQIIHYTSDEAIRVSIAFTAGIVEKARQSHNLSPVACAALGRTMTGAALLAGDYKNHEGVSIKIAGDKFDEAVVKYIRKKHNVLIGDRTAEELKMTIGCVFPRPEEVTMDIKGRCLMTGLPRVFTVSSSEMIEAFEEVSSRILEAIHGVLERTPPELVADISTNGIVMTGGGSLIWGFDKLVESHTGIETHVADDAISCVAYGTGKSLDDVDSMQDGTINLSRRKQMN